MRTVLWDGDALLAGRMQLAYFASPSEKEDVALRVAGKRDKWKVCGKPVLAFAHSGYDRAYTDIIAQALSKGLTHSSKLPTGSVGFFGLYNWDAILVTEKEAFHWTVWQPINDTVHYELVNILRPLEGKLALGEYASLGNAIFSIGKGAPATADTIRKHLNCPRVEQTVWRRSDKLQYGELRESLGELSELTKALKDMDFVSPEANEGFNELYASTTSILETWEKGNSNTLIDKATDQTESNFFLMLELMDTGLANKPTRLEDCYARLADLYELFYRHTELNGTPSHKEQAEDTALLGTLLEGFEDYDNLQDGLKLFLEVSLQVNKMIIKAGNNVYTSKLTVKEEA